MKRSALAVLAVAALAGCTTQGAADDDGQLRVVTTVAPLTSIIADVVGDRGRVTGLVPEGTNSHTFDPPPSAGEALAEADVIFVNGLKLEEPTKELAERTRRPDTEVVELGSVLPESDYLYDFSFPREEGKPNPHLWTDPTFAVKYAEKTRDTLSDLDPDGADTYRANTEAFTRKADSLADALRADQESLPRDQRELLTYHDAYAYFARTFGWTVIGAIQPKDFAEPTPREVAALIDQVRRENVKAVFGSEVFPSKVLEQIGDATGVRYVDVLRDDDLPGGPGDPEHSWLGLMRFDYVTMIEALGGEAPRLRALDTGGSVDADYPQ
ncbi:metal ABC transporter substrate-binding protein [Actinophytocola gossypii]|uniref:Zinc ABC transporter substrate-binding protein n=1 Tax=Actinophytocola gossypii TaxID=2812003 RepID=A0ABT2JH03_9PSEU|nr:metal ABC transporter substrate-binding protein [Actinophytocola gossypii]MCT2587160.1 zinc ABC transporter substrate-binding protein [Actinophytocola gossypii]